MEVLSDRQWMETAISEAMIGAGEGGIPIGACLVLDGTRLLGKGRNRRVQLNNSILHGETDCLQVRGTLPVSFHHVTGNTARFVPARHGVLCADCTMFSNAQNAGRLTAEEYSRCTLYSTLSPCSMCSGCVLLFKIPRVVIAGDSHLETAASACLPI